MAGNKPLYWKEKPSAGTEACPWILPAARGLALGLSRIRLDVGVTTDAIPGLFRPVENDAAATTVEVVKRGVEIDLLGPGDRLDHPGEHRVRR